MKSSRDTLLFTVVADDDDDECFIDTIHDRCFWELVDLVSFCTVLYSSHATMVCNVRFLRHHDFHFDGLNQWWPCRRPAR